eukprot:jgi/Antlo1/593/2337
MRMDQKSAEERHSYMKKAFQKTIGKKKTTQYLQTIACV